MASELPKFQYNYFLVYAPDVPNTQRLKHLPEHMVQNAPLFKDGTIKLGGGVLPPDSKTSDADVFQKVDGTFIVVRGESVEDVWEKLKKDVFYTSGEVWDHSKIVVKPAFLATADVKFE
ncbi:hypothetical protein C8Q70DRAFT_1055448 [Cubamyces menziesii]|uniref:YCII-related domain-containing protein n=1 Tax=Trametes cubensis TaxID=1111947 RepID=A0AAD7TFM6_9APHY|nr:hypothetical protein C8Q70DRAFT_1055448 [Cubamyces menziesii]KAJ8454917.1 hypothetical protein ONZ51_g12749 [Trametes cubensis]